MKGSKLQGCLRQGLWLFPKYQMILQAVPANWLFVEV